MYRIGQTPTCIDCHFLMKGNRDGQFSLTSEERQSARAGDYDWLHDVYSLGCHFGVWDEGFTPSSRENRQEILLGIDRRDFCFFWSYQPGMMFPAAKVLQKREAANRDAGRDRKYTIIGLWIAGIALAVSTLLELANLILEHL